jgi:predicted TIM-barrel fold metal-dependent hydrolase
MLLESVFNDETLRETRFVMLHGGWPFEREAGVMLIKPNVYADFSSQTFLRSTRALSTVLEEWLEWYPEKVLFGTDAYPDDTPLANWEEKLWLTTRTSREALALALTRMMEAGQITRSRAEELARMVMRENALRLYGLGG